MKDFLLIANKNCATYKEVFPLFKDGIVSFGSPVKEYEGTDKKFGNHGWITTLTVPHQKKLVLTATYDPELYPKYDNYNAIEVSRVKDIPYNYDGVMGVPITFLDQYNPEQFEIIGMTQRTCHDDFPDTKKYDDYREVRQDGTETGCSGNKTNENAMLLGKPSKGNYFVKNGRCVFSPYQRIFIRRKK